MASKPYPDNSATEAMIDATQKLQRGFVLEYHDEATGAHVSVSEFYTTIEKHYPGSGRHGCVIPTTMLDDVTSILDLRVKCLKE